MVRAVFRFDLFVVCGDGVVNCLLNFSAVFLEDVDGRLLKVIVRFG